MSTWRRQAEPDEREVRRIKRAVRREELRALGMCQCGAPAKPGQLYCARCAERYTRTVKELGDRRVAAGLCRRCGIPAGRNTLCKEHLAETGAATKAMRVARKKSGVCIYCKDPATGWGMCDMHRARHQQQTAAYKARKKASREQDSCLTKG